MKDIQQPRKQPEIIRKRIIEETIILASQKGISGVSIQSVADGVGITKGGVFHHFANKQILIEGMINELILQLDGVIEDMVHRDGVAYGQFTRAYIHSAFVSEIEGLISPWSALSMTMITDMTFNAIWGQWLEKRLAQHAKTDDFTELQFIRLATDGLWLQHMTGIVDDETCLKLKEDLLQRTYPAEAS